MNSDHAVGAAVGGGPTLVTLLTIYFMPGDQVTPAVLASAKAGLVVTILAAVISIGYAFIKWKWPTVTLPDMSDLEREVAAIPPSVFITPPAPVQQQAPQRVTIAAIGSPTVQADGGVALAAPAMPPSAVKIAP